MASRRDAIKMTDDEMAAFLDGRHVLQVASINKDGTPHLAAMYYAVIDGRVVFWTYGKSQKVLNLQRDPRITVMVEDGESYGELRGVTISGKAELSDDPDVVQAVGEAVYVRYFGDDLNEAAKEGVKASGRKRVAIFVPFDKVVSWDHGKLGGTY
jgi:PPOX class probable F420-dependent enzyme